MTTASHVSTFYGAVPWTVAACDAFAASDILDDSAHRESGVGFEQCSDSGRVPRQPAHTPPRAGGR